LGKFTDTKYTNTIDNLVQSVKENQLSNPYLKFFDKKATKVIYYKQNTEKSTVEEATKDIYQSVGNHSSIKYNKINDFLLYGIDTIAINNSIGEYGLEADEITGDAVILPNTISPKSGDYFVIPYLEEDALFRLTSTNSDTFTNNANYWIVNYKLERVDSISQIEEQVVEEYNFVFSNVGTEFQSVLKSSSVELVKKLDYIVDDLMDIGMVFFNNSVQAFSYEYNGFHMYDPYMTEFLIRNKIYGSKEKYLHIGHETSIPATFGYDYSKTWYALIENPSLMELIPWNSVVEATLIDEVNSLFNTRLEKYYQVDYKQKFMYITSFNVFPTEVCTHIQSGEYFVEEEFLKYNILIAHMKGDEEFFDGDIIAMLKTIDFQVNKEFFYLVPLYIYIINSYIESLMKKK